MADQNKQNKAHKLIHRTSSAYDAPKISKLAPPHHDTISGLLIHALTPIGEYRSQLPKPAKKSSRKRKRKAASTPLEPPTTTDQQQNVPEPPPTQNSQQDAPQPPSIQSHLLIGFNSITRHLEDLSAQSRESNKDDTTRSPHIAAVFLFRPMDDLIYSHLPILCHTASLAHRDLPPTRLVLLDQSVEKEVVAAIAQARGVSLLALLGDGASIESGKAVLEYVRGHVEPAEVPWLKQATEAQWLGTKVDVQ